MLSPKQEKTYIPDVVRYLAQYYFHYTKPDDKKFTPLGEADIVGKAVTPHLAVLVSSYHA
jgi:hypothetical protein